jgi:NADPH-dependent glutamate synthase beta subunit-like oxidoreductase
MRSASNATSRKCESERGSGRRLQDERGQGVHRRGHAPGQSLVVWAIREGRQAAHAIDRYLLGTS